MSASIQSDIGGVLVTDASRDDLAVTDIVTLSSVGGAATNAWTLVYVPTNAAGAQSGATLTSASNPTTQFTPDMVGAYLVRLVADAGTASEDTQYVRIRALTTGLSLQLVAAGERRDASGIIPVDVDAEGWANEQNENLLKLEAAISQHNYHIKMLGKDRVIVAGHRSLVDGDTVYYRGWCPNDVTLLSVGVYMGSINTQGTYTLDVTNVSAAATCLTAPFDMNTLVASAVTPMTLTGTAAHLDFTTGQIWEITLVSDDAGFDGTEVYLNLNFGVS